MYSLTSVVKYRFKGVETMLLEDLRVQIADMEKKLDEMRASL